MRVRTLAAALLAAGALATPAAAGPPDDAGYDGGCGFASAAVPEPFGGSDPPHLGTVYALVAATAPTTEHNPVSVTALTCDVLVNGSTVGTYAGFGAGPAGVLPPTPVLLFPHFSDDLDLCTTVSLTDAHGQSTTTTTCQPMTRDLPVPGDDVWPVVDEVVCAGLRPLGPFGTEAVLRVDATGDVYVAGTLVWDCPPYAT